MAAGRLDEAIAAHEAAVRLTPDSRYFQTILGLAKRDVDTRRHPDHSGIGMPPDPTLWDDPPEAAWIIWRQNQAIRQRNRLLPGGVPDPEPQIPMPGQSPLRPNGYFPENFDLPQPRQPAKGRP